MNKQNSEKIISLAPKTFTVITLGAIGFLIGYIVILYGFKTEECSESFVTTPQFTVWLFFLSAQTALWAVLIVPLWRALSQLKKHLLKNKIENLFSIFILTFLFYMVVWVAPFRTNSPLHGHIYKILFLTGSCFFITIIPAIVGIWLVHTALVARANNNEPVNEQIINYLRLREYLQFFLLILGTEIGAATLATGALRNAIVAWAKSNTPLECAAIKARIDFPPEIVLIYGPIRFS